MTLRRPEEPLHASVWQDVRKGCGWVLAQWRQKKPVECRYPYCSCPAIVAAERRAEPSD